jgi:2,3-bisphosphoglycerate-dependent phosphoglycerate mutase
MTVRPEGASTEPVPQARFQMPVGATQILLVRHGESAAVVPGEALPQLGGQADPPLAAIGHREADLVGQRLRTEAIAAIYCSPLTRTVQTAAPLAEASGLTPTVEPGLREVFLGAVDGLNLQVLAAGGDAAVRGALRKQRWELLPGAEPQDSFAERVRGAINGIAARHRDAVVVAFTHGGVIGQIVAEATGATPHAFIGADNGSITYLVVTRSRWLVRGFNDTSHLHRHPAVVPTTTS